MTVAVVVAVARRCQALCCRCCCCCCCLMLLNCRADPCKSVSATNPYVEAKFENFLGYFNSKNGVQITQTAYVRLDNSILSDNRQHGAEWPGAQGGEIAGGWGEHNAVTNCLFVGMSGDDFYGLIQDHNGKIYDPLKPEDRIIDFIPSASGIETPAWHKLSVMNTTFANYGNVLMRTRPGLIVCSSVGPDKCITSVDGCICGHRPWFNATMHALTAVSKSEHSFEGGGWEVRFKNITWVNAPNKVGWEWAHESVYVDLDGTFSGAGANTSVVPPNGLLDAFPECSKECYPSRVCSYNCLNTTFRRIFVPRMFIQPSSINGACKKIKLSYSAPENAFVHSDHTEFLTGKFRPDNGNADYLASLSIASDGTVTISQNSTYYLRHSYWTNGTGAVFANGTDYAINKNISCIRGIFAQTELVTNGTNTTNVTTFTNLPGSECIHLSMQKNHGTSVVLMPRIGTPSATTVNGTTTNYTHIQWSGCGDNDECDPWLNCTTLPQNCSVQRSPEATDIVVYNMKRRPALKPEEIGGYEFTLPVRVWLIESQI